MVEQTPRAIRDYGPENLAPGRRDHHERPVPERRASERRSLISAVHHDGELLGYVANLAHHVDVGGGAPACDRRVPRGLPGGRDHPAGEGRRGRRDRRRRLPADPRADPLEARDGRRLPRADRREHDGRAAAAGARRPARPRDDRRDDARAARLHRAPHPRRDRRAAARRLRGRGLGRHRRVHRRAGEAEGARRDLGGRRRASTSPAPTRSAVRRSTRRTRRRSPPARTR